MYSSERDRERERVWCVGSLYIYFLWRTCAAYERAILYFNETKKQNKTKPTRKETLRSRIYFYFCVSFLRVMSWACARRLWHTLAHSKFTHAYSFRKVWIRIHTTQCMCPSATIQCIHIEFQLHTTHAHIESICALYCLCFLLLLYLRKISVSLVHNRRTDVREWARASRCVCAQKSTTTDQKRANMLYDCILKQLIWMPYAMLL